MTVVRSIAPAGNPGSVRARRRASGARHRAHAAPVLPPHLPIGPRGVLPLPAWLSSALDSAWRQGVAAAHRFPTSIVGALEFDPRMGSVPVLPTPAVPPQPGDPGPPSPTQAFEDAVVVAFPPRPPTATDRGELRYMHDLARTRTRARTRTTRWLAVDGDKLVWQRLLAQWQATVSPAQAAWGAWLLGEARRVNSRINERAKQRFGRMRPYATDPTLSTVVPLSSASSASYPSGHAARAFLEATLLAQLMPHRRRELLNLAHQMAMSRIYGGVHYPSDTVGGAWEGAIIATWLIRSNPMPSQ